MNCPEGGNSGIYLRGRYEVQVGTEGGTLPTHEMGAIYSYYPPPSYAYSQPSYAYSPPGYAYSQPSYAYRSTAWDRNYNGIHPGPERTFP